MIFHIIIIIIFYVKQQENLDKKIKDIEFGINNWDLVKEDERKKREIEKKRLEKIRINKLIYYKKEKTKK